MENTKDNKKNLLIMESMDKNIFLLYKNIRMIIIIL